MEDLTFDDLLADVACIAPAAAPSVSPEARSHLDSVFGSYADDTNTCACPFPVLRPCGSDANRFVARSINSTPALGA